jgi:uncharacterized protein YbjT (DUF2867 family)
MPVLVTGATGNVGAQVVRALGERGVRARAFVRDPDRAARDLGGEVELAVGDFDKPASMRRALDGVESLFLASADGPRKVAHETTMIDAAVEAGVARIVKLSVNGATVDSPVGIWRWHGEIEEHLRAAAPTTATTTATVLGATFFMTNVFAMAEAIRQTGCLFLPAGDAKVAMIHPADVGAAAAAVLADHSHAEPSYTLTGPEAITFSAVAERLSAATGGTVTFVDVPDEQAQAGLVQSGAPEWLAAEMVAMFGELRRGSAARVTDAVRHLTGRAPRSFAEFARDVAPAFSPPASRELDALSVGQRR